MASIRPIFSHLTLFLAAFCAAGQALCQEAPSGRQIMEKNKQLHELKDEERSVIMHLVDRRNKVKKRSVQMRNMKTDDQLEKFMLVFTKPRDVKGTGLLTWEQKQRDDDQWLYLPSLKKAKRIASSGKKNRFMGTDFAFEDLAVENLEKHHYTLLESKDLDGQSCFLVEAVLKNKKDLKNSGYSKRVIWVRKDIYFSARIKYYDRKGKLVKILDNGGVVNVTAAVWRSDEFTMKNLKTKHSTRMLVTQRRYNQNLDENSFTLRGLKSYK